MPSFMPPPMSNTTDFDHSAGVCPLGKTTFEEIIGNGASGISVLRRYCSPRSKLWLPIASTSMPIMPMIGGVGVSPKKFEIGGVAPPKESPPMTSNTFDFGARAASAS